MTDAAPPAEPALNDARRGRTETGMALALACFLLLLDQATKILVEQSFRLHESRELIEPFFSLTYVRNYGAAWSLFNGHGWFLLLIAAAVTAASLHYFRYLTEGYAERCFAIWIILSGVVGNSIDRIWRGAVVDFFDLHWGAWHWPVFNVADIAICTGVGLFLLSTLLRPARRSGTAGEAAR